MRANLIFTRSRLRCRLNRTTSTTAEIDSSDLAMKETSRFAGNELADSSRRARTCHSAIIVLSAAADRKMYGRYLDLIFRVADGPRLRLAIGVAVRILESSSPAPR